jgi:DNA-binding NarL/FixJ family response regulator
VRLLLERGADVNAAAASGMTPVIAAAASNGPVAVLRLLIEHGADVNAAAKPDGITALMLAASIPGNVEKVRLLVAAGARPRRDPIESRSRLTASEQRVARMAADGMTNREIAQSLFLTEKTIEVHLTSTYRKLEIASRSQLPRALAPG